MISTTLIHSLWRNVAQIRLDQVKHLKLNRKVRVFCARYCQIDLAVENDTATIGLEIIRADLQIHHIQTITLS